ncbi:putative O-glycosylation ligase, exosortase A system-associated [Azoarcus sp. PA01]|nr:putative O-glycosylation ligase, exosortase A system-associated [Azoarcus sp. PA01]
MRDILITAIVLGALPFAFRHPYIGVYLWTWLSVMNPHRLAWGFAYSAPFAAMAAGATLVGLFLTKDPVRLPRSAPVYVLIAFILWMCATTALAIFPGESLTGLQRVFKIMLMTLVALAVLHEKKHIQVFVWINTLSLAFYGIKGGLYTIRTAGGGMVWGPGGFIEGNNEIGLAILMTIPFLYYLRLTAENKWVRRGLLASMLLCAVAVLGTQSRGAFLAIGVMSFVLWLRSPRKMLFGSGIVIAGIAVLSVMPWSVEEKIRSITEYQTDSSAWGRLNAWETAINVANDRPTGAGFDMYHPFVWQLYAPAADERRASDPSIIRAAHSIYFQVLGEHGWIGLGLFLLLWLLTLREAARLRSRTRGDPRFTWIFHLAGMSQVSLVGFAVGGAFLSLAYVDFAYNVMVILVVTQRWLLLQPEMQSVSARAAGGAFGARATGPMPPPVLPGGAK